MLSMHCQCREGQPYLTGAASRLGQLVFGAAAQKMMSSKKQSLSGRLSGILETTQITAILPVDMRATLQTDTVSKRQSPKTSHSQKSEADEMLQIPGDVRARYEVKDPPPTSSKHFFSKFECSRQRKRAPSRKQPIRVYQHSAASEPRRVRIVNTKVPFAQRP